MMIPVSSKKINPFFEKIGVDFFKVYVSFTKFLVEC